MQVFTLGAMNYRINSVIKTYFAEDASISFQAFSYILSLKHRLKWSIEALYCLCFSGTELHDIFFRGKRWSYCYLHF